MSDPQFQEIHRRIDAVPSFSQTRVERETWELRRRRHMLGDAVELSERTAGLMRALCEVVRYERDPFEKIDHVVAVALAGPVEEYRDALHQALASNVALARLGPEYHPEVIVRRLLSEVRRRLSSIN